MAVPVSDWSRIDAESRAALLARPASNFDDRLRRDVAAILLAVRQRGDMALLELTEQFDKVRLAELEVSEDEKMRALAATSADAIAAIDVAIGNVRRFHEAQLTPPITVETMPGVRCQRVTRPIDAVGLYVPAGTAPLPSAAIMLAVPAAIADCPTRILCTPPRADGSADAAVVVAAARAGIPRIFKIGGAQAIAAMAYGTASIPRVNKIFGPGNAWVTAAKSAVSADADGAAIDLPAGPSEVLVIADESANAAFVAADLLSQAEHGQDSQVILVTTSRQLAGEVDRELERQLPKLTRQAIAAEALRHARLILVETMQDALDVSNAYAPEHLILQCEDAAYMVVDVRNAGSVFVGPWAPEAVGDYCSGTNHVLPTYGYARNYSGLGVDQFQRQMTVQELSREGLETLAPVVNTLAGLEGLDAHAAAVNIRLARQE